MSYRVLSYHKACLSLVRHGWLVVLLLGRRISSGKAISPLNSRWALETSGGKSIDKAGSINCTSSTYSPPGWKIISPIRFSLRSLAYHLSSLPSRVNHGEWCRNENESSALLKPAPGQSIKASFEYSHGSANRAGERAAAVSIPNQSKEARSCLAERFKGEEPRACYPRNKCKFSVFARAHLIDHGELHVGIPDVFSTAYPISSAQSALNWAR